MRKVIIILEERLRSEHGYKKHLERNRMDVDEVIDTIDQLKKALKILNKDGAGRPV